MILEFKTKRNTYGHRNYLRIDTDRKEYSRFCRRMTVDGAEIKSADIKSLLAQAKEDGYTENDNY